MSSRSSSSSTFTSSTSSFSTTTTSTSLYSTSRPSSPPRYSTHFAHLSPCATPVNTAKPLPPSPSHHQEERQHGALQQQQEQQNPRWTPLSSHGLPCSPVPGQVLHRTRTRPRASSVSELPATMTSSEPADAGSKGTSGGCGRSRAPRSQSRPAARNPHAQQHYASGHRQTQSLAQQPQHSQRNHDCHDHHSAATERRRHDDDAGTANGAAAASASRESSGPMSKFKFKQLCSKVVASCTELIEREREKRLLATKDVVEVGRDCHWTEY